MFKFIGLIVTLFFLHVASAFSEDDTCGRWAAKITSMQGVVEIQKYNTLKWIPAKLNESLCASDSLRTAPHSRATVQIQEETFMVLKERTTVRFSTNQENEQGIFSELLNLFNGEAYFRSRRPRELGVETPFVNAMHEGTEFLVKVDQESTQVVVFDGVVVASNTLGEVSISEGQSALTLKGQAPAIGPRIELRDAVQWTLYYPPIIDYTTASENPSYSILKPILDRFQSNDLVGAFEQLDEMSEAERNADYQVLYASLSLMVGQVEQAQQHLGQVPQDSQQNAKVLALRSIIALAKNDQQQALKLAEQAQQVNPQAAAPKIALSYAYQSLFDIDKALDSATQAAQADPNNGLAWARVSEMELATGDVDASMEAASKAQALNPQLAKTNTVLGFARLASLDLSEAEQSFRTAIKRDPSDPLARLGLGLAKIRQGHIKSGTKEMETAANLDPDNALIRSYLGKAYYEQKRGDIASTEYAIAKKLDPNDPTPWFYDAIYKQTVNRPVEALHDMQKAIELNDNRAVFRSRLLLDEDLAVRSVSLARTYDDLGFKERARFESWRSLATDPANFSAHRFLSDSYGSLQRHEIARVSELLQSQLLQPTNATPLQPELAEANLAILEGTGPTTQSFYEFSPLFTRKGASLQTNAVIGTNDTFADDLVLSMVGGRFSGSAGQFHYETDGYATNRDFTYDIYNVFGQFQVTPGFTIQGELRRRETESGDLSQRVDGHDIDDRLDRKRDIGRLGIHLEPSVNQDVIGSVIFFDLNNKNTLPTAQILDESFLPVFQGFGLGPTELDALGLNPGSSFESTMRDYEETDGYQIEFQHLFRGRKFMAITGFGYLENDTKTETSTHIIGRSGSFLLPDSSTSTSQNTEYTNAYIYVPIAFNSNLITTLGLSYDSFNNDRRSKDSINPKIGIIWTPTELTTFRFAAFKGLKRPFASEQTIEPTQLAGFNQFFEGTDGTKSNRIGVALDQRLSNNIFTGIELSWRETNERFDLTEVKQNEELYSAYFYWPFADTVAFSTEFQFESFDRDKSVSGLLDQLKTVSVPHSLSVYHPSGFFGKVTGTYVHQSVERRSGFPGDPGLEQTEDFWVADLSVGYRLPKRYGLISVDVKNILNQNFFFQNSFTPDIEPRIPRFQPERTAFFRINLWFN